MAWKTSVKQLLRHLIVFFSMIGICAAEVTSLDLPDIGDSTGTLLSPEFERRLGQAFLSQIRRTTNISSDPEIETYISSIGYRLVAQSDNNSQKFTFFVVDSPLINAFAAPGGIVGINSGTIINSETESELAGVVAHEISHVTQRHMARSIEMSQNMSIPLLAGMLGAILVATQNPEAGQAAIMAVQGGAAQAQINFTRGNEEEADRVGMQLLERSGLDPRGMPGFFEKLQKNSQYTAQAPEFLRTHPLTTSRIADTRARAENYPTKKSYNESKLYDYIKAKLFVKTFQTPEKAVTYYKKLENENHSSTKTNIYRYGYALALMEAGKYEQSRQQFNDLLERDNENISFLLASAELERRQENYDAAIQVYKKMYKLYPDYRPLLLAYADTLLISKQPEKARDLLKNYGKYNETDLVYYEYLARAEAAAGKPIESSISNAEHYYLSGETQVAVEQLKHLLRQPSPKPDYYQEERIRARLAFLQQELQLERDLKLRK